MTTSKPTTKRCPKCGCTRLRLFSSINKKQCDQCWHMFDWRLEPGQKPLIGPSRDRYVITGESHGTKH